MFFLLETPDEEYGEYSEGGGDSLALQRGIVNGGKFTGEMQLF